MRIIACRAFRASRVTAARVTSPIPALRLRRGCSGRDIGKLRGFPRGDAAGNLADVRESRCCSRLAAIDDR